MKIGVPFFPMLTERRLTECKCVADDYVFSYVSGEGSSPLTLKPITIASKHEIPNFNLIDERGEWDPVHFDALLERKVHIREPASLFGVAGIAAHNARIGIAVLLTSLSSNHRFAIPLFHFGAEDADVSGTLSYTIAKNFYREKVSLKTILYLYEPGTPTEEEKICANLPGTVLGSIDEIAVYLDGTGSLFPVKKESDPSKPLWRVECDWADPYSDLFSEENVCIIFNQAHPNYGLLRIENGMNGSPFLADVIASALQIIIAKTIESAGGLDALYKSETVIPGSILDAVHYFISTFGWDPRSPEKLAETIRLDFDRRTGNDK